MSEENKYEVENMYNKDCCFNCKYGGYLNHGQSWCVKKHESHEHAFICGDHEK